MSSEYNIRTKNGIKTAPSPVPSINASFNYVSSFKYSPPSLCAISLYAFSLKRDLKTKD